MPITGIPLPLMSYGGSSVIATFLAIGLLQSIHVQARLSSTAAGRHPTVALSYREQPTRNLSGSAGRVRVRECAELEQKETHEEEHPRHRRPRARPASRCSRRRASPQEGKRPRRRPRATSGRSPSSTSSAAAAARSSATSTRARSTTSCPAWRPRSSTSAWSETASCTSTRSSCPTASRRRKRGRGRGRRIDELIKPGQEILVQVVKDPLKTKGARLSMQLSIAGRYLVYMPQGGGVGVSSAGSGRRARPAAQADREDRQRRRAA